MGRKQKFGKDEEGGEGQLQEIQSTCGRSAGISPLEKRDRKMIEVEYHAFF